ncbi:MAG: flagellar hook-basal body complex protein FliE [Alphaproteobacteria bacterium]
MPANIASALSAYAKTPTSIAPGMEARGQDPAGDFLGLVKQAAETAIETGQKGEAASMAAVAGKADITQVVTAVDNAEITLQTAIAIRDKVISAYQDITRMPL